MRTGSLEGLIKWLQMSKAERNKMLRKFENQKLEKEYEKKNNI